MVDRKPIFWIVDDVASCHELVRRSLAGVLSSCELHHYFEASEALVELRACLSDPSGYGWLPDLIFMDFYIGEARGDEMTRRVRALFRAAALRGPWIVGHSSVTRCSERIVEAGGDSVARKNPRLDVSPDIRAMLPDRAAALRFAGRASEPLSSGP